MGSEGMGKEMVEEREERCEGKKGMGMEVKR